MRITVLGIWDVNEQVYGKRGSYYEMFQFTHTG